MLKTELWLSGEYVDLRPLQESDAKVTLSWRQGERARLLNQGATTVEAQAAWIASRKSSERNFVIQRKDGLPIGMISLIDIDLSNRRAESARFLIGDEEAARGLPVAVESMKLLYQLAFDQLKLERIHGTVASENTLMIKWQKYLGMKEEGRLRKHYFIGGKFQDAVCLGILVDEYRKTALPKLNALIAMSRSQAVTLNK